MLGQGSPLPAARWLCWLWPGGMSCCALVAGAFALVLALLGPADSVAAGESLELRLRIAWGGGTARSWSGEVSVSEGSFRDLRGLGLEADSPATFSLADSTIHVHPLSPRSYEGLDISVEGPADATLSIELAAADQPGSQQRITLPLQDLISEIHNTSLDDQDNRLLIRRVPGDALRVEYSRSSLVFSPGEEFRFTIVPHHVGQLDRSRFTLRVQLKPARRGEVLWSDEWEVTLDQHGNLPSVEANRLVLPSREGAYDLAVSIIPQTSLLPTTPLLPQPRIPPLPFSRPKPVMERTVQLVVVDHRPTGTAAPSWREIAEIDPTKENWWDRLKRLPRFTWVPGSTPEPLTGGQIRTRVHGGQPWTELSAGGWQAYPLPVNEVGRPHIVEIEYPSDIEQTLGISMVEPNAAGQVTPIGLDSGFEVTAAVESGSGVQKHRLVYWPRTRSPLLLLTNRRKTHPAVFGRIRVLAGPRTLPPASPAAPLSDERLLAAYFDKPLFPANFGASEHLDPVTGRSLDDWLTFLDAGKRLVEYLKYAGYNGATVSVVCEGGTIYPSRLLRPTPKYDSGVFFSSGQDPQQKDVLEMLFRLFNREGLRLIPAIQFAAPLPELESQHGGTGAEGRTGVELVGPEGRAWPDVHESRRGLAPYYNPLDPRVQRSMRRVVEELTNRYQHHRAFAGVAIQLGPETYAQLPDLLWGCDDVTWQRFVDDTRLDPPSEAERPGADRRIYLENEGRSAWLQWRADQLLEFYRQLHQDVSDRKRTAQLYLTTAELLSADWLQRGLRPQLPENFSFSDTMLRFGLAPEKIAREKGMVLLHPQRIATAVPLVHQAAHLALRDAAAFQQSFAAADASMTYHEPSFLSLPDFDARSPFGAENTETWLVAHISPAGAASREHWVQRLAAADQLTLFQGGWMLPLGQEAAMHDFAETFRLLPAERFQDVPSTSHDETLQAVAVRRLTRSGKTYLYVVNALPWPVQVEVELEAGAAMPALVTLGNRQLPAPTFSGRTARWQVSLMPYDLVAATVASEDVHLRDWRYSTEATVSRKLRETIHHIRARVNTLRTPPPLAVLRNPAFELPPEDGHIPGWIFPREPGMHVGIDREHARSGNQSLHVRSEGPVIWVRSEPFDPPPTGRVFVLVWLRTADEARQPPLRLAVEGRLQGGRSYYRPVTVGAGTPFPLPSDWGARPFLYQLDQLPAEGISDLRVAFDLMGAGEVWIDDVQVHHLYFHEHERAELRKKIAVADLQLDNGQLSEANRLLTSYWPRFLLQHVPGSSTQLTGSVSDSESKGAVDRESLETPEERPSRRTTRWERLRGFLPF